jgi:hypothetical protein
VKTRKENTMRTSRKRYTDYIKLDLAVLANARRGLDLTTAEAFGDPAERARRVEIYTRQVEQNDRIGEWMPRVEPHRGQRHGRFSFGDVMLRWGWLRQGRA